MFRNAPLAKYTSFRIGGPADLLVIPCDEADLQAVIELCHAANHAPLIIGRGTNLLVRDKGVPGVVIRLARPFRRPVRSGTSIDADSGIPLPQLLKFCADQSLGGLEFLAGIPGSVGGAVSMNAGAWGSEVGERIGKVEGFSPVGRRRTLGKEALRISYRGIALPRGFVITRVTFALRAEKEGRVRARMEGFLERRKRNQPLSGLSAGCVFKNPRGEKAGRLIEECGLKGLRVGDAQVSTKHANFIINRGNASAGEVLSLARTVARTIERKTGIRLEREIQVVGKG